MTAFVRLTGENGQPVYVRPELVAIVSGWPTEKGVKTRVTAAYGANEWVREAPDRVVALLTGEAEQVEQRSLL
jgi:hypothetical protein